MYKFKKNYFLPLAILCFFIIAGCNLGPVGGVDDTDLKCVVNATSPRVTYTVNANGATNVSVNTKVGIFFTTEMNPGTFNASTFVLRQGKRHINGQITYSGLGAIFTPFRELTPYTTYTAMISRKVRDLAGNLLGRDYVWTWTTGSEYDTFLPEVIHTTNPDGATDVFLNTKISATFNKVMDASTISASTVSFMQGSTQVPGKVIYIGLTLVFIPADLLAPNTLYTGTITTGVKDLAGNSLSHNFVISWTTGTRLNTTTPYIQYTTPAYTRSISHGTLTVSATFSEPMDPLTITVLTFMLKQGTTPVSGIVLYNDQTLTASFTPSIDLAPSTTYTATLTTGIKDLAGNPLATNDVWSFTTSAETGLVPVNLGSAANFAILAGSTITNAGNTIVTGDIGLSPGIAVTGFPPGICNGSISVYPDPVIATAKLDLTTAFNDAAGRIGPSAVSSELGGTTLPPGLYNSAAGTFAITGTLTLDAQGNADAVFIFQTASTLVTAGNSSIVLINGAQAKNIFWQVGSSATIGLNSIFKGTIMAQASITISSGATIEGRALTQVAAVSLDTNIITSTSVSPTAEPTVEVTAEPTAEPTIEPTAEITAEPTAEPTIEPTAEITAEPTAEPTIEPTAEITAEPTIEPTIAPTEVPTTGQTAINLGSAANFAILAGSTITNAGNTIVTGDIGLSPGIAVTGFPPGILNGTMYLYPDPIAETAKLDLTTAYNDAAGRTGAILVSPELGGTTLPPGLYNSAAGTFAVTGILTLDALGNADAVFIFQAATTLVTAGNSSIVLAGGAQAKNVFWQVGSSATIGSNSVFKGTIIAMASVTVSSGVTIDGRALTQVAAVTLDTDTITMPTM